MKELSLFTNVRFWPLFWTQFCGAFNDNIFKVSLVLLILAQGKDFTLWGMSPKILQSVALGIFILPFFLFSATAGQLADKYDKASLIRLIKLGEVVIMTMGLLGFLGGYIGFLVLVLFLMGTQSTFFGPLKYSLLPQHLPAQALTAANGLIEMATFLAILLGTLLGGVLMSFKPYGLYTIAVLIVVIAVTGWLFSRRIPLAPASDPELAVRYNFMSQTAKQLRFAWRSGELFLVIFGISWFWYMGASLLTLLGPMVTAADELQGVESLFTILLTCLSIGIGLGSVLCDKLTAGRLSNHLVVIGTLGMVVFGIELYLTTASLIDSSPQLLDTIENNRRAMSLGAFFSQANGYRLLADLLLFGVFSGFYIVPLFVMLQLRSETAHRSRMIAVNNIINALLMVIASLVVVLLTKAGFNSPQILLINALATLIAAGFLFWKMPEFIRDFLAWITRHRS